MRERARRLIEKLMPWYDRAEVEATADRVEGVRRRSIAARLRAERVLEPEEEAARRLQRRADAAVARGFAGMEQDVVSDAGRKGPR